jgi:uncharacterized membrane protein
MTAWDDRRRSTVAVVLGAFITVAGLAHFVAPAFFDDIVPPWLPPGARLWTYASGVAELVVGPMLLVPRWRRAGGWAAIVLLVAVYPANLYMAWDWRDRPIGEQMVAWARLPLQFVLVWLAWQVTRLGTGSTPASPRR